MSSKPRTSTATAVPESADNRRGAQAASALKSEARELAKIGMRNFMLKQRQAAAASYSHESSAKTMKETSTKRPSMKRTGSESHQARVARRKREGVESDPKKKAAKPPKKRSATAKPLAEPRRTKETTSAKRRRGLGKAAPVAGPRVPQLCLPENILLGAASSLTKKLLSGAPAGPATLGTCQDPVPSAAEDESERLFAESSPKKGPTKKGPLKKRTAPVDCGGNPSGPKRAWEMVGGATDQGTNAPSMKGGDGVFKEGIPPVSEGQKGGGLDLLCSALSFISNGEDGTKNQNGEDEAEPGALASNSAALNPRQPPNSFLCSDLLSRTVGEDPHPGDFMKFRNALKRAVKKRVKHALDYNSGLAGEVEADKVESSSLVHRDPCHGSDRKQPSTLLCINVSKPMDKSGENPKCLDFGELKEAHDAALTKAALESKETVNAPKKAAKNAVGLTSVPVANKRTPPPPSPKKKKKKGGGARPYNRYNIYFILERERLILSKGGSSGPNATSTAKLTREDSRLMKEKYGDVVLPPLPSRFAGLRLPEGWFIPRNERRRKRPHRKTHGVATFQELAKSIAESWKAIDGETLEWTTEVEKMLKLNHMKQLDLEGEGSFRKAGRVGKKAKIGDDSIKKAGRVGKKTKIEEGVEWKSLTAKIAELKSIPLPLKIAKQAVQTQVQAQKTDANIVKEAAPMQAQVGSSNAMVPKHSAQTQVATLKTSKSSAFSNYACLEKNNTSLTEHNVHSELTNVAAEKGDFETHMVPPPSARSSAFSNYAHSAGKSTLNNYRVNEERSMRPTSYWTNNVAYNKETPCTDHVLSSLATSRYVSLSSAASGQLKGDLTSNGSIRNAKYESLLSSDSKYTRRFNVYPTTNHAGQEDGNREDAYGSESTPAFPPTVPTGELAATVAARSVTNEAPWSNGDWALSTGYSNDHLREITSRAAAPLDKNADVETSTRVPAKTGSALDSTVGDLRRYLAVMERTQEMQERATRELLRGRILPHLSFLSGAAATARGVGTMDQEVERRHQPHPRVTDRPQDRSATGGGGTYDPWYAQEAPAARRMPDAKRIRRMLEAEQARRMLERARCAGGGGVGPSLFGPGGDERKGI